MSLRSSTDLRLLVPAVACWLGAFVGTGAPGWWLLVACPLVMLGSALCWRRRALAAAAAGLSLGAGLAAAGLRVLGLLVGEVDELAAERATAAAVLVVTADPQRHTSATSGDRRGVALFIVAARLEQATVRGRELRARAPVLLLATDRAWGDLLPGQRVGAIGRLGPARPGQPLAAVLSVRGPPAWVGGPPALQRAAGGLRDGLREAVDGLPPSERGLVPGLVVGDTSRMPPDLETDFRTAGMTHLTAVSGANLVIVAGFVLFAARWLGVRGRALPVLAALAIVGFVVLARPQPSVLRAAVMGLVGLAGLASGRGRASLAALAAAMFLLLLVDPWLARSYGFALSVLATAGLLVLAPGWARWLAGRGVPRVLAHALAIPLAAQMACAPVVVLLSGEVSLVAVPANLLAAPAVAPATVIGVLAVVAGAVSEPVATVLGTAAGVPAGWIVRVAEGAAAAPLAAVPWPSTALGALSLAGVSCLALLLARRAASHPRFVVVVTVAALGLALVTASRPGWPPRGWVMVACDVGQGDALVLSAGDAGVVVVDAGPDPRAVDSCLDGLGVSRVALVVLTHLHADHVDGLPGVLRGRSVGEIQVGPYSEPAGALARVHAWSRAAGARVTRAVLGERARLGPLTWTVLWPARVIDEGSVPNNASVVLLARRSGVRMLLTGDMEQPAQRALLARWRWGTVDVLKVAHHGSADQEPDLLTAVRPRVALVSAGVGNDYGHPAPQTLAALRRAKVLVGRTDRDGTLAVVGPLERLRLVKAKG